MRANVRRATAVVGGLVAGFSTGAALDTALLQVDNPIASAGLFAGLGVGLLVVALVPDDPPGGDGPS